MWVRIDDGLVDHPKVLSAGALLGRYGVARALAVYIEGLTYAGRKLTDGALLTAVVRQFKTDPRPLAVAKVLTDVGLWEVTPNGFQVHDYHDFNPSADEVKKKRAKDRHRKSPGKLDGSSVEFPRNPSGIHIPRGHARALGVGSGSASKENEADRLSSRAGAFCERYRSDFFPRLREVAYVVNLPVQDRDLEAAEQLCAAYTDAQIDQIAETFLQIPDDRELFLKGKTRTVSMLVSKAPAIAERLAIMPAATAAPREGEGNGAAA